MTRTTPPTTLLVIAKEPVPGRVKTRLTPPFTPAEAARLAAASLNDTLHAVLAAPVDRRVLVLAGSTGGWLPPGIEVVPQCAGGLDERLAAAFSLCTGPAVLIGMDTPQVSPAFLAPALGPDAWQGCDAWFGPAVDGGFWALGLAAPDPVLLRGVPMSVPQTGAVQRQRLTDAGLVVRDLPLLRDVDTAYDAEVVAAEAPHSRFATELALLSRGWGQPMTAATSADMGTGHAWRDADPYTQALRTGRSPLFLRRPNGLLLPLDVERWCAGPDTADMTVLKRCRGSVLDIGCGPGRFVAGLAALGHRTLGIDVSPAAVDRTVRSGGNAVCGSVFDPVPDEGGWETALLVDGNIGIGGDPRTLLERVEQVVAERGVLIAETAPADIDERVQVRVDDGRGGIGASFSWARVGSTALLRHARATGWAAAEEWTLAGRSFVALVRDP